MVRVVKKVEDNPISAIKSDLSLIRNQVLSLPKMHEALVKLQIEVSALKATCNERHKRIDKELSGLKRLAALPAAKIILALIALIATLFGGGALFNYLGNQGKKQNAEVKK